MKKLLFALVIIVASGSTGAASMNVDADSNTLIDIAYGGTNSDTAAGARSNLGLGNVDNTSDMNKPISTAAQAALDLKQNTVSTVSQGDAEAGTSTTTYMWTPQRVAQAIAALAGDGTGDLLSTNNLSDLANAATARANLSVYSAAETDAADDTLDEAGNYTFTGTFDSSGGTVILPQLTLDPYDSGWAGSQLFASQGDVYGEMETKEDSLGNPVTDGYILSSTAAGVRSWVENTGGSGGTSATISTSDPTYESSTGFYGNTSDGGFFYKSDDGIFDIVAGTYTADPTAPAAPTMVISGSGPQIATFTYSEAITADTTADLCDDWSISMTTAGSLTLGYSSGDTTTSVVCSITEDVFTDDTVSSASYTQGTIQANDDNTLMDNIADFSSSITNSSTESSGSECDGFLVCQNFEGTGYDNNETTWSAQAGADPDYSGVEVIRGSQSMEMDETGGANYCDVDFAATSEIWVHVIWKETTVSGSYSDLIAFYSSDGGERLGYIAYAGSSTDTMRLYVGSSYSTASIDLADDTSYHFWFHFNFTNNTGEFYYSTDGTRPGTPTISHTGDNTLTTSSYAKFFGRTYVSNTYRYIDQVLIKDSSFTTVPN